MFQNLRMGLSMRKSDAVCYHEKRDGLACLWYNFLATALPGSVWVALPNRGEDIVRTVEVLGLNGIVLTGGEDYGVYPQRDRTETALISYGLQKKIPLLGVCRGLQILHSYFGGSLAGCSRERHVAVRHDVFFEKNPFVSSGRQSVNSYHTGAITPKSLSEEFRVLAQDADGLIEGMYAARHRLTGIMWHPEREQVFAETDITLFRNFFTKRMFE